MKYIYLCVGIALLFIACQQQPLSDAIAEKMIFQQIDSLNNIGAIDSAVVLAKRNFVSYRQLPTDHPERLEALIALANVSISYAFTYVSAFDSATKQMQSLAVALQHPAIAASVKARIHNTLAYYYYGYSLFNTPNHMDSARYHAQKAVQLASNDSSQLTESHFYLGLIAQNNPDTTHLNTDSACYHFQKTYHFAKGVSKKYEAYGARHLAFIYLDKGYYARALAYAKEALRLRDNIGIRQNRPASLTLIGDIFRHIQPDSAIHYHRLAVQEAEELQSPRFLNNALLALGDDYAGLKDEEQAKKYYQRALEKATAMGYANGQKAATEKLGKLK